MSDEKKLWTFGEMYAKVRLDTDLEEEDPDETFVSKDEMIGYFNEAVDVAEAEIMVLNQDYFLTFDYLPVILGTSDYDLPTNIYGKKIRGVIYENGSIIYPIRKFRPLNKFESISFANQYSQSDDYRYYVTNNSPGGEKFILVPPARETAVVPPMANTFTPIRRWYIRNANRVPITGEYTNPEKILATSVDTSSNQITVAPLVDYVTGDKVKLSVSTGNTLPTGLSANTVYYVIAVDSTTIKLATSAANASAGTAIDITGQGSGFFTLKVAATDAIIDATVIDIPEFSTFIMEWVKANCVFKEGDPRITLSVQKIADQRKLMQDTLAESIMDEDNEVDADFTFYNEHT